MLQNTTKGHASDIQKASNSNVGETNQLCTKIIYLIYTFCPYTLTTKIEDVFYIKLQQKRFSIKCYKFYFQFNKYVKRGYGGGRGGGGGGGGMVKGNGNYRKT
jgi:hypothetical protein